MNAQDPQPGPAVSLNFDDSVGAMPGVTPVELSHLQEEIRLGCALSSLDRLVATAQHPPGERPRLAFLGSGDFHHVSFMLAKQYGDLGSFQIVVFDNHPDNMLFPFGIHCGSWVWHATRLPFVSRITVIGITSTDVGAAHLWENHQAPLRNGKLSYWCCRPVSPLARALRLGGIRDIRDRLADLPDAVAEGILHATADPIYLSIDKDVLAKSVVETNWDQGVMTEKALLDCIRLLRPRVFAADITGETSRYVYRARWKRILSALDGQRPPAAAALHAIQARHHALNLRLRSALQLDAAS